MNLADASTEELTQLRLDLQRDKDDIRAQMLAIQAELDERAKGAELQKDLDAFKEKHGVEMVVA